MSKSKVRIGMVCKWIVFFLISVIYVLTAIVYASFVVSTSYTMALILAVVNLLVASFMLGSWIFLFKNRKKLNL